MSIRGADSLPAWEAIVSSVCYTTRQFREANRNWAHCGKYRIRICR